MYLSSEKKTAPRSSLAAKHSIDVGAGVIDSDYRGEVMVVLFNHSDDDFQSNCAIKKSSTNTMCLPFLAQNSHHLKILCFLFLPIVVPGDKIAQLILERIKTPDVQLVNSLENTERGSGGFGSTGKNIAEQSI